jgi:hypothetical protein
VSPLVLTPEEAERIEQRRLALHNLLVTLDERGAPQPTPDPTDLRDRHGRERGHRWTMARDPGRDPDIVKRDLGTAYVEHRRQDHGHDISCVVAVYETPKLKLVLSNRHTGTEHAE